MRAIILLCLLPAAFCGMEYYSWYPKNQTKPHQDTYLKCYDQASCGCCLMERQMGRLEMYFNKSVEGLQKIVGESKLALNNMRASRSAFSVAPNNDSSLTCFGPFPDDRVIVYEHIFLNLGSNYNMNTGIFTVPRSGVYSFALTIYGKAQKNDTLTACAILRVNGIAVEGPHARSIHDYEDSATAVSALKLKAGDEVDVVLPAGCFFCDNSSHYNTFTGFLLYATDHSKHTRMMMMMMM